MENEPQEPGELAQRISCLLCKHKDLSLDSNTLVEARQQGGGY